MQSSITRLLIVPVLLVAGALAAPAARADSALDQLNRTANGQQHTGVTFDCSPVNQRRGGIDTIVRH